MYHPYFRGKQFELICIREMAEMLANAEFVPIIEPVNASLVPLRRTLQACVAAEGDVIAIINPEFGPHSRNGAPISDLLSVDFGDAAGVHAGILLSADVTVTQAEFLIEGFDLATLVFIHAGFSDPDILIRRVGDNIMNAKHIFIEEKCSQAYRRRFDQASRVLIRDGFERMRNRDYRRTQLFSDLHHTYTTEGMEGFGDFLIAGDEYRAEGGPAYAVAIHITYIDPTRSNDMYIYHFVSDTNTTPQDPAGKFAEALQKLITRLAQPSHHIFESQAIAEFRSLHRRRHFPGLGVVKKLSMNHHIATLDNYID